MKTLALLILLVCVAATAQTLPTLPASSTITAGGTTCTFSVTDAQLSVAVECLAADNSVLARSVSMPSIKGTILGTGPILCLLSTDGASTPTVRLQCSSDDDTTGPKLALDGKLTAPPANKKRQWWLIWK